MSCAKMIKAECGAPAFRVVPQSNMATGYLVYFLEYDSSMVNKSSGIFNGDYPYD